MSVEFQVIGELKDDPGHFLLIDNDGQCYDYDLVTSVMTPIEVDGTWVVDVEPEPELPVGQSDGGHRLAS